MKRFALFALAVLSPLALSGQGVTNIFRDTAEVHVINVDVVVTDPDGRPVTGLTAEDFQLFEDGRPVEISNFFVVEEGRSRPLIAEDVEGREIRVRGDGTAAEAEPAELHLAVFVDNATMRPAHRNRVLRRLDKVLERSWRPGLSVMLVSNERGLEIRQPFTGRREAIAAALDELEGIDSRGLRLEQDREALLEAIGKVNVDAGSGLYDHKEGMYLGTALGPGDEDEGAGNLILSQRDVTAMVAAEAHALVPQMLAYAQASNDEVSGSLKVLHQVVNMLAGLPGRKAVLHVSDGLSLNPAEAVFEAFDRLMEVLPDTPELRGLPEEAKRYDLTEGFEALTAAANAGRVSLYTLDASPPEAVRRGGAEVSSKTRNLRFSSTEERNQQESLVIMADGTGGRAALSNSMLDTTLTGLFEDFASYYSLGYQVDREPGRERHIEVRMVDPERNLTARHRKTMRDQTPEQRMAELTMAALMLGALDNPLEIELEAQAAEPTDDGNFLVPVMIRIPLGNLVLVPGAQEHQAHVSMYVAVVDEKGRTSEVTRQMCPIRIPNSELLVALGRHAGCGLRLLMRSGEQTVAVGVRDELSSRDSTVRLAMEVGASGDDGGADAARGSR